MTVLMVGIGRLIGNAHGKQRDRGRNEIQPGMSRFRQNAQASGTYAHNHLERGDGKRRHDRAGCHGTLLGSHGFEAKLLAKSCWRAPHVAIISFAASSAKHWETEPSYRGSNPLLC